MTADPEEQTPGLPQIAKTLADIIGIAVAIWLLLSDRFAAAADHPLVFGAALAVIGTSVWRLWRRHGPRR